MLLLRISIEFELYSFGLSQLNIEANEPPIKSCPRGAQIVTLLGRGSSACWISGLSDKLFSDEDGTVSFCGEDAGPNSPDPAGCNSPFLAKSARYKLLSAQSVRCATSEGFPALKLTYQYPARPKAALPPTPIPILSPFVKSASVSCNGK